MDDQVRPPVLAHQRFAARRESFDGLSLKERFEEIHATNLWGAQGSVSGLGSEPDAIRTLRTDLVTLLKNLGAGSLLDAPCGDASWIHGMDLGLTYHGIDIVPGLIAELQQRADAGELPGTYQLADLTCDDLPGCDVILCRDCLVHLSFANVERAVTNMARSGATWLITTTFTDWDQNADCEDGDWRALNLRQAPFSWPRPEALINENCREGEGGWADKSLGLWRMRDLPIAA
jgi:hypothetical protein